MFLTIGIRNMEKRGLIRILLVLLCVIVAVPAVAGKRGEGRADSDGPRVRTEWGIGVGASYTFFNPNSQVVTVKPRFNLGGQLHMGLLFGKNFALEAEIHYQGGSLVAEMPLKNEPVSRKIKTSTIDVPVMMSLRMLDSIIQLDAGILFTVMSRSEYTFNSEVMYFGSIYPTFNFTCGAGFRIGRHFLIEAHYVYPLGKTSNQFLPKLDDGSNVFKSQASRITAGVTLVF